MRRALGFLGGPCLIGMAIGGAAACVVIDPNAKLCAVGGADCACTVGGACDPGLMCEAGTCIDPNGGSTGGSDAGSGSDSDGGESGSDTMSPGTDDDESDDTDTGIPAVANHAFVTSTRYTAGGVGGLAGADAKCQQHADMAGLPGTYVAWLSLPGDDARDRIGDARGWIRPDGKPLATDLQQVMDGRFFYPPVLDEAGGFAAPDAIWTGTIEDGTAYSADALEVCSGWTSDEATGLALAGDLGAGPGWWTAWSNYPCNTMLRLACFGVDHEFDLTVEPADGRLAFVSNGLLPATAGRASADAMCQTEASDAGHGSNFLALMAVNGEAPAARFDAMGPPWVRVDGIPIFEPGAVLGPRLETPILYDAMGNPSFLAIGWAGSYAVGDPGMDSSTCTNWTQTTGLAGMFNLIHIFWQGWSLGGGSEECAQGGYSVICLEQ